MFVHYRTRCFVLKKINHGESDSILTVLTEDFGKLEILGKSIRKINSKLKSSSEIFYLSEIEFIQGKIYKTLTDSILIKKLDNIRKDLKRLKIAYKITEIFDELIPFQEKDKKLWHLLIKAFEKLNEKLRSFNSYFLLYYYFLWNLLSLIGYEPELNRCVVCQKKLKPEKMFFCPKDGGILCDTCESRVENNKEISENTVKILRTFLKQNWTFVERIKIDNTLLKNLKLVSENYVNYILDLKK